MKTFTKTYLNLLYENTGAVKFDLKLYNKFLNDCKKIDKFGNIINEDKTLLIDIPDELITYLIKNNGKIIKVNNFIHYLKQSKHWRNLKNNIINDIFFIIFDFSNDDEIDKFHYTCFNIDKHDLNNARVSFKLNVSDSYGFFNIYNDLNIICINKQTTDIYQTIYHELSHFIQVLGNIRIVTGISENDIKQKNLLKNIFNIDYDTVIEYFSDVEFIPHVDDLINMLKNTKNKCYESLTNFQFLDELKQFLSVKNHEEMINHKFFKNFIYANNRKL